MPLPENVRKQIDEKKYGLTNDWFSTFTMLPQV